MGFFGGALGGYADEATKMKGQGRSGALRGKKKLPLTRPNSSNTTSLTPMAEPGSFRKGGRVKKTGFAKVHKGEQVIPAKKRSRRSGKRR
jgi:hypothetical protein